MLKNMNKQYTNPSIHSLDQQNLYLSREDDYENQSLNNSKKNRQLIVNITDTRYPIVKKVLKDILGFKVAKDQNIKQWDLTWTDNVVQPQTLMKMKPYQKINHFPGMYNLSRKNYLARNLIKMSKQFPNDYDFFPKTWSLPSQYNDLKQQLQNDHNCVVIAKPQASCQGKGIFLSKSIDDFILGQHYVVQKYMKKPLLIDDLKFDLRIYVLVAGCNPLRLYIYKQGLARFATELYSIPKKENFSNLYMHLTNYAINKANSKFQFNQSQINTDTGHKRSLTSIFKKLENLGHNSEQIWQQICELITKSIISVQPNLAHQYRSCQPDNISNNMCFQILGFDIILQSNLKPYILQVNYTPSFTTDTPLDLHVKQNLIKDSLVLMNISNKFKNDILNLKKRQIIERTLTGKKTWQNKQQIQILTQKYKHKRDRWQDNHLGNFQKLYPIQNKTLMQKYQSFLNYSKDCYLSGTGGNIKRNHKISLPNRDYPQMRQSQKLISKPQKMTNSDQLQRIYIKRTKLMMSNINKRQFKKQIANHQNEKSKIQQQQQEEKDCAFPTVEMNHKQFQKSKIQIFPNKMQIIQFKANNLMQKKALSQFQYRSSSVKNRSKISKVYKVTFKEMKVR